MNGYQIDSKVISLAVKKYLFHGFLKNDTIPFEFQFQKKCMFYCKYNCENFILLYII